MKVLVTGHAEFIGFHLAKCLLERSDAVGFDVVNDYYDPNLKEARLRVLEEIAKTMGSEYVSICQNLAGHNVVDSCFREHCFERVIHLAAQAGVRYSLANPHAYVVSNLIAFINLLEAC